MDCLENVDISVLFEEYPTLRQYSHVLQKPNRDIIGRDREVAQIRAALARPELSNVMLIAPAGAGKSSCVQLVSELDTDRLYLEIDLARMLTGLSDANQMASILKTLFDEASQFYHKTGRELVLFIDEFHQIVSLSEAAAEALKPLLADSAVRGIRVIAATTTEEFIRWIKPNLPLQERLQRINLDPMGRKGVIAILRNMAKRYDVSDQFYNDHIFEKIYDYTEKYIPASVQPRKSIRIFDSMIGWYRSEHIPMDESLLADVIFESEKVRVNFSVDAQRIKEQLDEVVLSQEYATSAIAQRLQICCAGLNNPMRPMSSFLFCGATGTGKTAVTKELARLLFGDQTGQSFIRMDMTEFANPDSLERFRKELTDKVWANPYSVVMLDEIEKACSAVTRVLLQVLDDGRLLDSNSREVTFNNAYIVMTTNAGNEIYKNISQYNVDDKGSGKMMNRYFKLIRDSISHTTGDNRFPPELLGRIDCIVPFQPLSEKTQKKIVYMQLQKFANTVRAKHDVRMVIDKRVVDYLVEDNMDTETDSGGARGVISKMEQEVVSAVATYINKHPERRSIAVLVSGKMMSEDKTQLESAATIVVQPARK